MADSVHDGVAGAQLQWRGDLTASDANSGTAEGLRYARGMRCTFAILAALSAPLAASAQPVADEAGAPRVSLVFAGLPEIVFARKTDACDGHDVPDAPLRAFRDADGRVAAFGMHHVNRALRGASLDALKLDCRIVLASGHKSDPALHDDYSWIAATWSDDGKNLAALIHQEYHANDHAGRCAFRDMLPCWNNSVLAATSADGGRSFTRGKNSPVVAAYPYKQETGQGRHRGFFNPSNIFSDGEWKYTFIATTGWSGQKHGACLFRTKTPGDATSWRAWDGKDFTAHAGDVYAGTADPLKTCQPIAPFVTPVGAVVRHLPSGAWVAVLQAARHDVFFSEPGIWVTASRDLFRWSKPRLVMAGKTLYDDPCQAGQLISYPSLLDSQSPARNFDTSGDVADLYYATLRVDGCRVTSDRDLMRRKVRFVIE